MSMQIASPHNLLSTSFGEADVDRLRQNVQDRVPFYVRMQISSFEARAACLLHAMVNGDRPDPCAYHAFFGSGTSEAISGALKIVRHNHQVHKAGQPLVTAVYDPSGDLQQLFDPFSAGLDEALVPGLIYFDDFGRFCENVNDQTPSSLLFRHGGSVPVEQLSEILKSAADRGIYTVLDESTTDLSAGGPIAAQLKTLPDVIAFGENLADHKTPAGCFMMSKSIYKVWDNVKEYNLHSNTWGGNSASMAAMLAFLKTTPGYASLPRSVSETMEEANQSHLAATKLYETHCSPKMATMLNISGLNKNIRTAYQARITTVTRRGDESVIDASGTYGVNLHGHNPDDVIDAVMARHDVEHDYWANLHSLVERKTGFKHVIPAVSGATATEAALTFALLAAAPKKKIVALKGGFGGKTLISLIVTSRDRYKVPFGPLYPHIHYVDPFGDNGKQELLDLLKTDDVAVVLLETVQGEGGVKACPQDFLDFLSSQKEQHGFFIAVDEVQTGMYRTGQFLNYQRKLPATDIVLMGKAISDNVFPVSAVLMTDRVYEQAVQTKASVVERLENMYRCQFGAHMAVHAIEAGESLGLAEHAKNAGEYFAKRLREKTADLKFVKQVRGEGLMIGIEFEESLLPRLVRGSFGGLIASRCVNDSKQPILVAFNPDKPFLIRFVPPLCITIEEIDAVIDTFNRALRSGFFGLIKPIVVNTVNSKLGRF
ncbi:aminotransferase class III-fold pyridoxal phosphate-dependent enzyme [Aporhodopirellula aestuarii]|uniref:Aminotransferase class III-fold pyridoxal phosphate-dependent enzyme n=1 Tax=Aporhodopirellula aestuarii TaxID=2950107 RepID=A0ABT0TX26_9BACT|nr:aminotransferase class III-fold pyridoxal phosphate-dependent enzyme [Aporhodopirellula aestuarii]MCM2369150.1 aminotransferase class III-fold pyridoxal phosphate-dependent enzyme [Aporhodopirellula aestuarii]